MLDFCSNKPDYARECQAARARQDYPSNLNTFIGGRIIVQKKHEEIKKASCDQ